MKDFYDFSKMKRVPHPMQDRIDRGELKLKNRFEGMSEEEIQTSLSKMSEDAREFILRKREERKQEVLLQEISQVEKSCNGQIPSEVINLLEKIKAHLSHSEFKKLNSGEI